MKKKIFSWVLIIAIVFSGLLVTVNAYDVSDWQTGSNNAFGYITEVNSNVMNVKGNETTNKGPYTKASTQKLSDGIVEDLYIELDPDKYSHGELFTVDVPLDDKDKNQVADSWILTQKVEDKFVFTTNFDPDFKAEIDEKGVYTYRFNLYKENGKVYFKFQLLLWDDVKLETSAIDLEPWAMASPLAEKAYAVRSVWFTNITAKDGVNVYKELPKNPNASEEIETPAEKDEEYEVPNTGCFK